MRVLRAALLFFGILWGVESACFSGRPRGASPFSGASHPTSSKIVRVHSRRTLYCSLVQCLSACSWILMTQFRTHVQITHHNDASSLRTADDVAHHLILRFIRGSRRLIVLPSSVVGQLCTKVLKKAQLKLVVVGRRFCAGGSRRDNT
jgi:hypothetical protein